MPRTVTDAVAPDGRPAADLLQVRDLAVTFAVPGGTIQAVKGVSFRIRPGQTLAIVGESGSGKSVMAHAIMGILPPNGQVTGGSILLDTPTVPGGVVDLTRLDPSSRTYRSIRGGHVSMIFQEPMTSLSPLHTVGNQIVEAVRLHRTASAADAVDIAREMLRWVGFPDADRALRTYPFELSGGMSQRAMIAMALAGHPGLLIADEPTTALDVTIQAMILKLLKDLQAELGMAILLITHDLGIVANMADDVVVVYRGEVMEAGTRDEIFGDPRHPYLKALLRAVPRFHMADDERLVPIRAIRSEGGELLARRDDAPAGGQAGDPLLRAEGLTKRFVIRRAGIGGRAGAKVTAVEDVGFELRRGECLGLVGESGSGKTTLAKLLMRALTPDSGTLQFYEHGRAVDLLALAPRDLTAFRRRMQFVFQNPFSALNPRMTVFDTITEPLVIHDIGDADYRRAMAKDLMRLVGLDAMHLRRYPHSFSGGQRQRIGIARALALRPDILICDEPVSALDVSVQAQVLNLLKDLQAELGLTYLFISHNLAVVDYIADRIMVMCRGRVVEIAPREALFRNPVHPYTQALLAAVPHPDPSSPLDLHALMEGRASDPSAWPPPFTEDAGRRTMMVDLGGGHLVRAQTGSTPLELAS